MATTIVSRPVITEDNQLIWEYIEVEETNLLPDETPLPDVLIEEIRASDEPVTVE